MTKCSRWIWAYLPSCNFWLHPGAEKSLYFYAGMQTGRVRSRSRLPSRKVRKKQMVLLNLCLRKRLVFLCHCINKWKETLLRDLKAL